VTNIEKALQANKGEWSELYVLFKIFDERTIPAADSNLQPLPDQKYTFLKVLREEVSGLQFEYNLEEERRVIIKNPSGGIVKIVDTKHLNSKTKIIFKALKHASSASFVMEDITSLMSDYLIGKVKASSAQKTDILAVLPDNIGTRENELGFSVKSHVGGAPTLVNSSSHTNFVYDVTGFRGDVSYVNSIEGPSKIRRRISAIKDGGATITFRTTTSSVFNSNLRLSDTSFPIIMADVLLAYYSGEGSTWPLLAQRAADNLSLDVTKTETTNIIKTFLRAAALGMVPSKEWDTKLSAYGGYIIVLNDGRIVCYHLLNDDEFKEYLYKYTKIDTPSTTKFKFGDLYLDGDRLSLKLNLQIRFLK